MTEIYINGEKASWKRIKEEYGALYCEELKEEVRDLKAWESLHNEEAQIDIFKY